MDRPDPTSRAAAVLDSEAIALGPPWHRALIAAVLAASDRHRAAELLRSALAEVEPEPRAQGFTDPPLYATALLTIHRRLDEPGRTAELLTDLYPALATLHLALHTHLDPGGSGLAAAPAGAGGRGRVDRPEPRRDLVFNTVMIRADRDLAEIAWLLGHNPEPFEAWAQHTADAVDDHMWDEAAGGYRDLPSGDADHADAAIRGAVPLFAAVPGRRRAELVRDGIDPSAATTSEVAWLVAHGLRRYGFEERAGDVASGLRHHWSHTSRDPSPLEAAIVLDLLGASGRSG